MKKQKFFSVLKYIPLALCIILIILYLNYSEEISMQTILDYTPDNLLAAALVILFLYALKSMSIVFPIIVLEVAAGHIFPVTIAIIINIFGMIICLTVPYFVGYFSGSGAINKMTQKYPILEKLIQKQSKNSFFACFFVRTLYFLPRDAVSMFFGAVKFSFGVYLLASALVSLPNVILATLFGTSITEPASPMFWISTSLMIIFAGVSLFIYNIFIKGKQQL